MTKLNESEYRDYLQQVDESMKNLEKFVLENTSLKYGISFYDENNQQHNLSFTYLIWRNIYGSLAKKFPEFNS